MARRRSIPLRGQDQIAAAGRAAARPIGGARAIDRRRARHRYRRVKWRSAVFGCWAKRSASQPASHSASAKSSPAVWPMAAGQTVGEIEIALAQGAADLQLALEPPQLRPSDRLGRVEQDLDDAVLEPLLAPPAQAVEGQARVGAQLRGYRLDRLVDPVSALLQPHSSVGEAAVRVGHQRQHAVRRRAALIPQQIVQARDVIAGGSEGAGISAETASLRAPRNHLRPTPCGSAPCRVPPGRCRTAPRHSGCGRAWSAAGGRRTIGESMHGRRDRRSVPPPPAAAVRAKASADCRSGTARGSRNCRAGRPRPCAASARSWPRADRRPEPRGAARAPTLCARPPERFPARSPGARDRAACTGGLAKSHGTARRPIRSRRSKGPVREVSVYTPRRFACPLSGLTCQRPGTGAPGVASSLPGSWPPLMVPPPLNGR